MFSLTVGVFIRKHLLQNFLPPVLFTSVGPHNFLLEVSTLLDVRHCPKLQSCAISRKSNDANLRKWRKT